jgi:hypothetical protein
MGIGAGIGVQMTEALLFRLPLASRGSGRTSCEGLSTLRDRVLLCECLLLDRS